MKINKNTIKAYESDASQIRGKALNVVLPTTIEEVKRAVINSKRIVARGGGTGLVGGCVPQDKLDTILDLSKLDTISNFNYENKTVEVEAGVILDDLQEYVSRYDLEFPVNPFSHSVCTLGGMIATNAVGSRALKYGRTSNWIKWIEVVDSDGKMSKKGITEISDYSGMEGITGIIVRACLKLSPKKIRTANLFDSDNYNEIISLVKNLKRNRAISMIELLGKMASKKVGLEKKYHLIIEYEDGSGKLSGGKYNDLLMLREKMGVIMLEEGHTYLEDPKVMLEKSDRLVRWLEERGIPFFGHIGSGIFHPGFNEEQKKYIPEMMKLVKRLGGRISGEYGIGLLKKEFVDANDKKIIANIKKRTDPKNKFNVGKVI